MKPETQYQSQYTNGDIFTLVTVHIPIMISFSFYSSFARNYLITLFCVWQLVVVRKMPKLLKAQQQNTQQIVARSQPSKLWKKTERKQKYDKRKTKFAPNKWTGIK